MLPTLLAVRTVWIAVLFAVIGICVLWFVLRVIGDLIVWFREEIGDEYKELREQSRQARKAKHDNRPKPDGEA